MQSANKFKAFLNRFSECLREHLPQMLVALVLIAFLLAFLWDRMVISVNSGEAGVLYRRFYGGTVVDKVFGEGIHLIFPWNSMTVYNIRYQTMQYGMDAITKRGLTIRLDVVIRYRPEYQVLGVLHQAVGTDYANTIVRPEVESSLRTVVGNYDAAEICSDEKAVVQTIVNQSLKQVSRRFVLVDSVMITKVTLPEAIQKAISYTTEQEQLSLAYEFKIDIERKEAIRKKIEAEGIKTYNDMINVSLNENVLRYEGISATKDLSKSQNSKIIVIGAGKTGLPVLLDTGK